MLLRHVALISQSKDVGLTQLTAVSGALQKQVSRDLGPLWTLQATVDAYADAGQVPIDYWRVTIVDEIADPTELGFHKTHHNQPYSTVLFVEDDWTVTLSHEVLEMLVDPSGDRLIAGPSPTGELGRVNYLVEICDPVQASKYTVNDIAVCDFVTPEYFDPLSAPAVRYSYSGKVTQPREVLRGGYLSFFDPIGQHWWQQSWSDGARATLVDVGADNPLARKGLRRNGESLRQMIDRVTRSGEPSRRKGNSSRGRHHKMQALQEH